jgi:hypothetical protein
MLVTLITHAGDRALAVNLCARIQQLGGVQNHECLIVSPQGTNMDGIENVLKRCFRAVYVHQYAETLKGWPAGPNEAAAHAMLHCWTNNALLYHYLLLEPDCVPVGERWLDIIDITYRNSGNGTHVLGVKTDHWDRNGRVIGRHTVGVAVYPKNWPEICSPIKTMIEMSFGYTQQKQTPPPWDVYCGPYTNRCTAETHLIQHLTVNPTNEGGYFHWDCPLESALQQVSPRAVLVHGCKNPEFLFKLTGTKPAPIHAPQTRKIESHDPPKHIGTAPRTAVQQNSAQVGSQNSEQASGGNRPVESPKEITIAEQKRRKEISGMRWPRLKSYAAKIGVKVHRIPRPDIEIAVLEVERKERIEKWTQSLPAPIDPILPVEEMAPPIIVPPVSTATMTAIPWNSEETAPPEPGGKHSPQMQQAMRQLMAQRQAAGMV